MEHRMKCALAPEQVDNRLSYRPTILEFHLRESDLTESGQVRLCNTIERAQKEGTTVYLHHPMNFGEEILDILHDNPRVRAYYEDSSRILHRICKQYGLKCVIHCHYADTHSSLYQDRHHTQLMRQEIEKILAWSEDVFLWENTIDGLFSYHNPYLLSEVIEPLQLPLVHDISHSFIGAKGDNERLQAIAKAVDPYVRYLHVVDSFGMEHDGLTLGTGAIDWSPLEPYITGRPYIYEILLDDLTDATPMADSARYFEQLSAERKDGRHA